jgi:hypothetical protein
MTEMATGDCSRLNSLFSAWLFTGKQKSPPFRTTAVKVCGLRAMCGEREQKVKGATDERK